MERRGLKEITSLKNGSHPISTYFALFALPSFSDRSFV